MTSEHAEPASRSFMHYEALKTAIANGEQQRVTELLANQSMPQLEKSYLLDIARLSGNASIIALLEAVPETA